MIVADVAEDVRQVLAEFPHAAAWRIGVARYTDGPGSDIDVMYVAGFHAEADGDFCLAPEGMGDVFALEEQPWSAQELLAELDAHPDWATHVAYVHSDLAEFPDGSFAVRNAPLSGTGVHHDAKLVYFYYEIQAQPERAK
ncbi:hypothetical protein [Pseudoxanthomonas sp. PXM01]|uniref:hypothetical protein n=1 Tax=Pseudoxanthomonas sp. PXM01 TaxID=2769295 RepID=UPI001783EBBE|nr:hypothetical protein [Pseudoxanthomonas sp. PXM01]MBD9468099.1 hypothetical protein [Pseudoxanthomonas sp. PXM01]